MKKKQLSCQLDKLLLCFLFNTGNSFTKTFQIFCPNQNLPMQVPILHINTPKKFSRQVLVMFSLLLLKNSFYKWFLWAHFPIETISIFLNRRSHSPNIDMVYKAKRKKPWNKYPCEKKSLIDIFPFNVSKTPKIKSFLNQNMTLLLY